MLYVLLAPGPSMTQATADRVRSFRVGVINNCFELAPWADFLASSDAMWWEEHPQALALPMLKFSAYRLAGVEKIHCHPEVRQGTNSGVLALEVAKRLRATRIALLGFDMHGTHFFGPYTNGLNNTNPERRRKHHAQYKLWAEANPSIEVINCTHGSELRCFPFGHLDELT